MTREQIQERYPDSKLLFFDGFDDAILGVDDNRWNQQEDFDGDDSKERVVYSVKEIIEILMSEGLNYEKSREHVDINVIGGYVGIHTPVCVEDEDYE